VCCGARGRESGAGVRNGNGQMIFAQEEKVGGIYQGQVGGTGKKGDLT